MRNSSFSVNEVADRNLFFVWKGVLACNSAFCMQYHITVRVYTRWHHPGLSFVNETSPTIRWLKMEEKEKEKEENCHVLTTARRADEGRGKNRRIPIKIKETNDSKYII